MQSGPHELFLALGDLLGAEFVAMLGLERGASRLRSVDKAVPQLVGPEHTSDRAYELCNGDDVVGGMIPEAQQSALGDKVLTWPLYWAMLRKRVGGAPTWLVVLTTSRAIEIAAEAVLAEVIPRTGRWLVLGPMRMPRSTDPELAGREPAMALISALIHAGTDDLGIARATAGALHTLETLAPAVGLVSYDILRGKFSEAALAALEAFVDLKNYKFTSDIALENQRQGREEGRLESRIATLQQAVRTVLESRGFSLAASQRVTIDGCTDAEQLETWLQRAVTAASVDAIFD